MSESLPNGWVIGSLSSLVSSDGVMVDGDWVESKDQDPTGKVRLIQLADVGSGTFLDKSNRWLTTEKAAKLKCTTLNTGDVLIARLGEPLGKACIFPLVESECVTVVDVHIFRSGTPLVSHRWLMHALNSHSIRAEVESQSSGTTRKRITGQKLKDLHLPIPPSSEQQRIASRVDELFSSIDEGERALGRVRKLVERYRQSVLKAAVTGELTREWREQHAGELESGEALLTRILEARRKAWETAEELRMTAKKQRPEDERWKQKYKHPEPIDNSELTDLPDGWVWSSIGQVGLVTGGLTKNQGRAEKEHKRPYLRVANVYANRLDLNEIETIGVGEAELDRVLLKAHDLLVVEGNGSIGQVGRVALWDGTIEGCVHQNHIIKVRFPSPAMAWYALVWCLSPPGRALIEKVASSTAGLHTLSITKIETLPIPVPSSGELAWIHDQFERMTSLVTSQQTDLVQSMRRAAGLRQSVLRSAFLGALVPQDEADEPASALLKRLTDLRAAASSEASVSRGKQTQTLLGAPGKEMIKRLIATRRKTMREGEANA